MPRPDGDNPCFTEEVWRACWWFWWRDFCRGISFIRPAVAWFSLLSCRLSACSVHAGLLPRLCNVSCETLGRGRPSRWCRGDGGRIARNWRCGEIAGGGDSDNRAQYPYWGGFGDVSHETSGRFRAVIAVTYNQGNAGAQPRRAGPALNPHGHNQPGGALVVGLFDDANPVVALQV